MIHDIKKRCKTAIMIKPSLILRTHEETALTDENGGQVLCFIDVVRRAVGLEAIDANLVGFVQIPAGLRPQRFHMTLDTMRLPTKKLVPSRGSCFVKVHCRGRRRSRNDELKHMK